jgi:hypothetical protein
MIFVGETSPEMRRGMAKWKAVTKDASMRRGACKGETLEMLGAGAVSGVVSPEGSLVDDCTRAGLGVCSNRYVSGCHGISKSR